MNDLPNELSGDKGVPKPDVSKLARSDSATLGKGESTEHHANSATSDPHHKHGDQDTLDRNSVVIERLEQLQRDFETKIKYDGSKEKVIDALHRELQEYREDFHFKILRPVFRDLISMYDDIANLLNSGAEGDESKELKHWMSEFQATIEDILFRHGVETYEIVGDEFVARRQRALSTIKTDDQQLDRKVAERLRRGFAYDARVLRPEIVKIYRYVEQGKQTERES